MPSSRSSSLASLTAGLHVTQATANHQLTNSMHRHYVPNLALGLFQSNQQGVRPYIDIQVDSSIGVNLAHSLT